MNNILIPGSVINTSNHTSYEYYLAPSNIKHGCIYFGKGLKTFLGPDTIFNVTDIDEYVINANGKRIEPQLLNKFLKGRNEVRIYNFCDIKHNISPMYDVMYAASRYACNFLGCKFSFRNNSGYYCFQIVVKSYKWSMAKYNINTYDFNIIMIGGHKFYNSRSISNHIHFYLVYKKYNDKEKVYLKSNCRYIICNTRVLSY